MPALNWDAFKGLPGSAESNFEMLCRALIRRNYGRSGDFVALAAQPGVEFHLKLHTPCALGDPGRWYGWQCRWYDLPGGRAIGTRRRNKIREAIAKTERELPGLTDWVLWTRRPLTKGDQNWFCGLKTQMRLAMWSSAEVEDLLSGDAEILRATYFGELVLTPERLVDLHAEAVAPIRRRWQPEVHQTVDAERELRRMLGETQIWGDLRQLGDQLEADAAAIDRDVTKMTGPAADAAFQVVKLARDAAAALEVTHTVLDQGDLALLSQQVAQRPAVPGRELTKLPRYLRASRQRAALAVTNALADIRRAHTVLDQVQTSLGKRLVAVVADAGCGKTQLAAQLTSSQGARPAGILLQGRDLNAGQRLDGLAQRVVIQGKPVRSMEELVAALDAAGQRAHRRLPIAIDGLNEAEDPRDWNASLSSLHVMLREYPYVLVVCTLRTAFVDEALPSKTDCFEIPDFGNDTVEAIKRYFAHYLMNALDAELPIELLRNPLTLRLFCEVTNPKRERWVGIEAMPGSLTSLFERYLEQAAQRIAELAPRTRRYYEQDVRSALDEIGTALWDLRARTLSENDLRAHIGDQVRPWNESIVRALEHEGVVLRVPGKVRGEVLVTVVYDALAGHLAADAILARSGRTGFEKWLRDPRTVAALAGPVSGWHPLAADVLRALVGLVPRQFHRQQLWQMADQPLKTAALREAASLDGAYLDAQTVEELTVLARQPVDGVPDLLDRLWHTRGAQGHPLNAEFLDAVLRPMRMAARDLRWSEWARHNDEGIVTDLRWLEGRWRSRTDRSPADTLRARWVMWVLTSTVRNIRDQATRALYWFGRGNPDALFDLTLDSLAINDPYVSERMLAASYGTAMALHADLTHREFIDQKLPGFALRLYQAMFAKGAPFSTTHALTRNYARHTVWIALLHHSTLLDAGQRKRTVPRFHDGGIRKWGAEKDRNGGEYREGNAPIQMDFENYTIGRLVPERGNYQYKHAGYQEVLGNIYWRLYGLGYSLEAFGAIDKGIASSHWRGRLRDNAGRIDRYGKKYSWIAFYELYGLRYDKGLLKSEYYDGEERPSDVDIDPSFPDEPHDVRVITEDWLGNRDDPLGTWIEVGGRPDIMPYLVVDDVNGVRGPWVLLDGFAIQVDERHKRALPASVRGLLVAKQHSQILRKLLARERPGRLRLPDVPEDHNTFAGEIPWCETFPKNGQSELEFHVGHRIKKSSRDEVRFYRAGKSLDEEETTALLEKLARVAKEEDAEQIVSDLLGVEAVTCRLIKAWSKSKEPIIKTLPVLIPVRETNWGSYHSGVNPGQNVMVPAREIAETFRLSIRIPSWDMYDADGKLASISIKWGNLWTTGHRLCYLRMDILPQFLNSESLDLVWVFWGAREIRSVREENLGPDTESEHWCKQFQRIYRYDKGRVIAGRATEYYE